MQKRHLMIYMLAVAGTLSATAQEELRGTLYVEGEYVPAVVRRDKIHLLPGKVSFELPAFSPAADTDLLTGNYSPYYNALPAPVWRGATGAYPYRGYVMVGLGSYLNSTLSAGYRVADTESTRADVWLQHNSTSLMHPRMNVYSRDWKRYRYDERIGVDARHLFSGAGTLSGAVSYHLGKFNYYGAMPHPDLATPGSGGAAVPSGAPEQTLNDAVVRLAWHGERKGIWSYAVRAGASYFGYDRNYTVFDYEWVKWKGQTEFEGNIGAGFRARFTEGNQVTADVDFTALGYNKVVHDGRGRSLQTLRVAPAYLYCADRFSARLGVTADFTWGAGRSLGSRIPDQDYSTAHVAPDVRLSYDGGTWGAELRATGGQRLQTLRAGYELDYYQQPLLDYVMPAFVPVEATARFQYNGTGRFRAGVDFTYASVRHQYLGGWYMADLSGYMEDAGDFDPLHCNLSGYSIGVDAEWHPLSALSLRGRGTWQPQGNGSTTGFFNGYDRPRWTADVEATVRPMKVLDLTLAYRYRGVRNIYERYGGTPELYGTRLPDICNLSFGARYRLNGSVSFFGSADNLLCRRVNLLPCQPSEGFNFLIGADVIF